MKQFIKLFTNELKNRGLSLYDKAVFGSLITKYQYHNNTEFYTYGKFIADELEIGEATVKRCIKKLHNLGLINIKKRFNKQLNQTINYYSINLTTEALNDTDDNSTTNTIKTPQNENMRPTEVKEYEDRIAELQSQIDELTEANDYLQNEMETMEKKTYNLDTKTTEETIVVENLAPDTIEDLTDEDDDDAEKEFEIELLKHNLSTQYENLSEVIEDEHNTDIKTYFKQFKDKFSIGYDNIYKLADDANIDPNDVLEIYELIKDAA